MEPMRVLHVLGRLDRGGAESRIMDIYRGIDRERVQFDFLVHTDAEKAAKRALSSDALMAARAEEDYDGEIRAMGGRVYALPRPSFSFSGTNLFSYRTACARFFRKYAATWRVVQGHMTSTAAVYLAAAKRAGIPVTVAHVRSAGTDPGLKGFLTKMMRLPLADAAHSVRTADGKRLPAVDLRFACSEEAARAAFRGAPVVIVPNAIRVERFLFRAEARERLRTEWSIGDRLVIGHVGSFRYAKNHEFLLRVFAELLKRMPDRDACRLLLVGDGGRMEEMRAFAASLGISGEVIFAGKRADADACYQAMDIFAFPSRYEGLPGSVIEAQASGLFCLISDQIARETDVTALVERAAIGKDRETVGRAEMLWAEKLRAMCAEAPAGGAAARQERSAAACARLKAAGYDVAEQARRMERFYLTGELT